MTNNPMDWGHKALDWGRAYRAGMRDRPVRAQVAPGDILALLPENPPETPEPMEAIWADFERIVPQGLTHWQHPRFFAYFSSNAAPASVLAEHLVAEIAAQGMLWQTAPVVTELEMRMIRWLAEALGLPGHFTGVTHDTASTATFTAVLTMRERALNWAGNARGLASGPRLRIYASAQTHSSVDKAVVMAGIGRENLVKIPTDDRWAMRPDALAEAIAADRAAGHLPAGVVLCVGGTGIGASDPIADCIAVAREAGLTTHVDAAWAGSAMVCPEQRVHWAGIEQADSIVFNPHKWLGAQFDCSVQFLADPTDQIRTMAMRPEYLHTPGQDRVTNFSEWTPQLGRPFRALKLWFLLRAEGLLGMRTRIGNHIRWAQALAEKVAAEPGFELTTPAMFSLFTFRHLGGEDLDAHTLALVQAINDDGRIYVTQTVHEGATVIRFQVGQWDTTEADVAFAWDVIREIAARTG
ncbi:MAG: pyridoxal-dependent decarboxylase [Pseudomonadota bacterium]